MRVFDGVCVENGTKAAIRNRTVYHFFDILKRRNSKSTKFVVKRRKGTFL